MHGRTEKPEKPAAKHKKRNFKLWIVAGGVMLLAGLVSLAVLQYREINNLRDPSQASAKADVEAAKIKTKVSKIMLLPEEDMTLATVQNVETLKKQSFFKNAENGDKVLIFADAKQAIIYREKDNRIINAGPIVLTKDLEEKDK